MWFVEDFCQVLSLFFGGGGVELGVISWHHFIADVLKDVVTQILVCSASFPAANLFNVYPLEVYQLVPENIPGPKRIVFHPSIFQGLLLLNFQGV